MCENACYSLCVFIYLHLHRTVNHGSIYSKSPCVVQSHNVSCMTVRFILLSFDMDYALLSQNKNWKNIIDNYNNMQINTVYLSL